MKIRINTIRLLLILLVICFLFSLAYFVGEGEFDVKADFNFRYFANINSPNLYSHKLDIPIYDQLYKNKIVLKNLKTYIIFDRKLYQDIPNIRLLVNGYYLSNSYLDELDCEMYEYVCLVKIPNYFIDKRKVDIDLMVDLFKLSGERDTFIGIYSKISEE